MQRGSEGETVPADSDARTLPPIAWRPIGAAMAVLAVVLSATSNEYGFERDELYFRMLRPAWGYTDQASFTPLLGHLAALLSPSPWVERIPATVFSVGSVLVVTLTTRELGGSRGAQTLCAWGYATASIPLVFGHVLLTATVDLVVWPLACLFVLKALLRDEPRWWLAVGALVGLSTYNKWLIALLAVAVIGGLVITGPRRVLVERWFLVSVVIAAVLSVPNLVYQIRNGWPELIESQALRNNNAGTVRVVMWPYLLILLGPALVPIWVAGLRALRRRPAWRPVRFLPTAFAVLLIETFLAGGQLYYPIGLLAVVFAAGCVPAAEFLARSRRWRTTAIVAIAVSAAISAVIALPLVPIGALSDTPIPAINKTVQDQVGWPAYVAEVAAVYRQVPVSERIDAVIIASNYGEAGALAQYGPGLGLPQPYSGHNALYSRRRPPAETSIAVLVGGQYPDVRRLFGSCSVRAHLDNRRGVDNEEQGLPIAVCRAPDRPWSRLWPLFRHYG